MQTLGELTEAVSDWLNREDSLLIARIPDFIRLAENDIYRNLRSHDNQFIVTYLKTGWTIEGQPGHSPTVGQATILPPNFSEMTLVTWNGLPLKQLTDTQLAERLNNGSTEVCGFCITGRKIRFAAPIAEDPASWSDNDTLVFTYYGTESLVNYPTWQVPANPVENPPVEDITPQDNTQTEGNTTRMLQRNPDLYLNGALYHASMYLKDPAAMALWGGLFKAAQEDLRIETLFGMVAGDISEVTSVGGTL